MDKWKDLQLRKLSCEKDLQTAYRLVLNFFNNQGFEFCAFASYLGSPDKHANKVNLNNYPYGWDRLYEQNGYASCDPVVAHCNQSPLPILWDESLFAQAPKLWLELNRQGLRYGWTQAVHDEHGGYCSLFSLARTHSPIDIEEHYGNLGYAIFASQRLHALASKKMADTTTTTQKYHLSPREIEVLRWSAEGKTASEVGRILCLSERTVNFHVCSCMRKLNVNNKISAVAKAAHIHVI
ncbi:MULTISPECIES: autoinducer binding domain-containing protein [unclassified Pseudomonas]|uniref:autoinducer binding domain-containing protein n=1 Tax=unclassified Pseudomonas TaxID=196821 RepID=UPI0011A93839|nr:MULTISPECIES: autoinducer binding domain-containing protein [unclassified Pseudomonas]TWC10947.1 LuxR family transcriptional regulator [Pseudomonas sp. SJZ075]TWC27151.1 LuxR family transcriptional regulator [Pseudomonas sp. SJZ078]TWC47130.1 LuxR family transcriptional regulator [Pseudomonas sp. SJZ124]TWC82737.1 LuxR family transcriptional regulator [Pseudomonas sp. SJZ101]